MDFNSNRIWKLCQSYSKKYKIIAKGEAERDSVKFCSGIIRNCQEFKWNWEAFLGNWKKLWEFWGI